MKTLTTGTRVYNNGDICNPAHFGTITAVRTDKWGTQVQFTPDAGQHDAHDGKPYWVSDAQFCPEYLGHGGTRFVTEAAYKAYRAQKTAEMKAKFARMNSRRESM